MNSVLITGSNRGIGLEFARQYAQSGWRVFGTCRRPAEAAELHELAGQHPGLSVHRLDVTVPEDIRAIAWELEGMPLDVLINNAGVYIEKGTPELGGLRYEDWLRTFEINTLGGVKMTEALLENVARGDKRLITTISSHMGSIADIQSPGSYYYRSSKAALNATMQGLAVALRPRGIGILLLHPGWVRTRMGGSDAIISSEESVRGMRKIIDEFTLENSGRFIQYDGTELPW